MRLELSATHAHSRAGVLSFSTPHESLVLPVRYETLDGALSFSPSTLRFALWSVLRAHPNATFWATDHLWQASLNASDPAATPPCRQCSYGCKRCLRLPAESAHVPLSVGLLGRRMDSHEYLDNMRNATFCLVPRGDNEMTRKFTEAIVVGCIPVMIVDMPALPFERRLDYAAFSYEFDLKKVLERPTLVMETTTHHNARGIDENGETSRASPVTSGRMNAPSAASHSPRSQ